MVGYTCNRYDLTGTEQKLTDQVYLPLLQVMRLKAQTTPGAGLTITHGKLLDEPRVLHILLDLQERMGYCSLLWFDLHRVVLCLRPKAPAGSRRKSWAVQGHEKHTLTSLTIPKAAAGSMPLTHRARTWRQAEVEMQQVSSFPEENRYSKAPSRHTFSSKPRPVPRHRPPISAQVVLAALFDVRHLATLWTYLLFLWEQGSWERRNYHDAVISSNHLEGRFGGHLVQSWSETSTITRTCRLCLCLGECWKLPRIEFPSYLRAMFFTAAQAP